MHLFLKLKPIKIVLIISALTSITTFIFNTDVIGANFAARVSPPNFELKAKPGKILREIITIENADVETAVYQIRTADWALIGNSQVQIHPPDEPLTLKSCRPWTRIERKKLKLSPKKVKRYRFEVHVPEDAESGECRFAIVISPAPETLDAMELGNLKVPIMGAIAVIVYVTVGDAAPVLEYRGAYLDKEKELVPVIQFFNSGNAHARPFGSIQVIDADSRKVDLLVSPFPILPGRKTGIKLMNNPQISGIESIEVLVPPLQLKGLVEWDGGRYKLDTVVE